MSKTPNWLRWTAAAVLLVSAAWLTMTQIGIFDPRPLGSLVVRKALADQPLTAGERQLTEHTLELPGEDFTARLTAALATGETDTAFGLAMTGEEVRLLAAVSPLGYAAVWTETTSGEVLEYLMPWQTWPHVATGNSVNEIWLDFEGKAAEVRLNRELLWSGPVRGSVGSLELYAESFGGAAVVDFTDLRVYAP